MQSRVGAYQILIELQGFQSVRAQVTLLAGQTANIPVQMQPATLQENVTVTAEAPLVNVTQTSPAGNIDPKQFSELPRKGATGWRCCSFAPGSRTTSVEPERADPDARRRGRSAVLPDQRRRAAGEQRARRRGASRS